MGELDQLIVLEFGRAVAVRDYHRVVRVWVEDDRLDVFEGAQAMGTDPATGALWIADDRGARRV